MNERIRELALQASGDSHYLHTHGEPLQKFAELIIRETLKVSKKYANDAIYGDEYEDCGIECMSGDMERHTLNHFGVLK